MGLHINEKYTNNQAYMDKARKELKQINELAELVIHGTDTLTHRAFIELLAGQNPVKYLDKSGVEKELLLEATMFDKIDTSHMSYGDINRLYTTTLKDSISDVNDIAKAFDEKQYYEGIESVDSHILYAFSSAYKNPDVSKGVEFSEYDIAAAKEKIDDLEFGWKIVNGATVEKSLDAKPEPVKETTTLSERILNKLDAKKPEDWLQWMPSKRYINSCIKAYETAGDSKVVGDVQYAMGQVITESAKGMDVTNENIKGILTEVKNSVDEYKNISGFRRFMSYINPFKDSVRDMRNEINQAKELLEYKNIDMKQLDAFLDGKARIETVEVPKEGPYQNTVKEAEHAAKVLDNWIEKNSTIDDTKLQINKIVINDMIRGQRGEAIDLEASKVQAAKLVDEETAHLYPYTNEEAPSKWPIDEKVMESLVSMEKGLGLSELDEPEQAKEIDEPEID